MALKRLLMLAISSAALTMTGCPGDDTAATSTSNGSSGGGDSSGGNPTITTTISTSGQMTGGVDSSTGAGPATNPTTTNPTTTDPGTDSGGMGGDCCAAHATPGCDDMACQDAVCAEDQFCCAFEWDMGCADIAATQCAGCGGMATDTGAGTDSGGSDSGGMMSDCCTPTPGVPGCAGNVPLETCVCALDDFCCMMEWDQQCVNQAAQNCGANCMAGAGDCCSAGNAPGCNDATCQGEVCAVDPFCCSNTWDGICANQAGGICDTCGGGMGDCCMANPGMQGCGDDACINAVCGEFGADPSCCTVEWTQACATLAGQDCAACGGGGSGGSGGGGGDCCAPNGSPGCDDATCEMTVCAFDPFCCSMEWDNQCAGEAGMSCPALCGGGGSGDSGGGPFTCDVAQISGCVDEDPATCTCEACDPGGGCSLQEDCVCPDCAADNFCASPNSCNFNGQCDPYNEGCACTDCADHPLCP